MFGFQPFSDEDFSDISQPAITGYISATDQDDTATINAQALVTAYISTTDQNDTATINGAALVTGSISVTDQDDTAQINANALIAGQISTTDENDTAQILANAVITGYISTTDQDDTALIYAESGQQPDTHDGFTKDEIKRWKKLQKKLAIAEAKRIQARLDKRMQRKAAIKAEVSPEPIDQVNQAKVESVKVIKPVIDIEKVNAEIARLEAKQQELLQAVAVRQELARLQTELAIYEAKVRAEELDDEESILLLM